MRHTELIWIVGGVVLATLACSREASKETGQAGTSMVLRLERRLAHESAGAHPRATTQTKATALTPAQAAQALSNILEELTVQQDVPRMVELIGELGRLDDGSPEVLALCARLMEHADPRVRVAVLEELWFFDDISTLTTNIIPHLRDPDSAVRALAAERLGEIESPLAIEVLIQNLTNDFADVCEACKEALLLALAERFDTPEQAYQWWRENRDTWFDE